MSTSPEKLIGTGIVFPLNINQNGTLQIDTGMPLLKSSVKNIMAFIIGDRYFLPEFGAGLEDLLETPNDDITYAIIDHRLKTQIPFWDKRLQVERIELQRKNQSDVDVVISIGLKSTDLTDIIVIPITLNTVQ